jgi:hypothetical protein
LRSHQLKCAASSEKVPYAREYPLQKPGKDKSQWIEGKAKEGVQANTTNNRHCFEAHTQFEVMKRVNLAAGLYRGESV